MLGFYVTSDKHTPCDISSNINYTLYEYIIVSLCLLIIISFVSIILTKFNQTNVYVIMCVMLTMVLQYGVVLFVLIGGIFIAQQMNNTHNCMEYFTATPKDFSIYIGLFFLALINLIFICVGCKLKMEYQSYDYRYKESEPLL